MQIKQLKTILNETLLDLPFYDGKINNISIWRDHDNPGLVVIIKDQEQEKSVFSYDRIYLKINEYFVKIKTPENQENLFKTVINSILAYLEKIDRSSLKNFDVETNYKKDFFENFKIKNSNYFNHNLVYPTTYGLGYYCLLLNESTFNGINKKISKFLKENTIDFKNEFSNACWVYRFKFKSLKENNIKLLNNLILEL